MSAVNPDGSSPQETVSGEASLAVETPVVDLIATPPPIVPSDFPYSQADTSLIRLDQFRADPRFAGIDGHGLSVVVLDTGVDLDHSFFGGDSNGNGIADRIVYSYDFSGSDDSNASDTQGHGSNVASIIGSQDGTYTGMAPGVNLIVLKVFPDGANPGATNADIAEALDWVVANRAAYNIVSVNMSLGNGTNYNSPVGNPYGSQFATLAANNTAVVVASGNSYASYQTQGVSSPSADPNAWSIGAVWDRNAGGAYQWSSGAIDYTTGPDQIISFSQRSATKTTVFAPGGQITGANATGGTSTFSGTSQAAPHVAGLVADMQQLAMQVSGHFLSVNQLKLDMINGSATIFDGDDENDNVANTFTNYRRVDALGWANQILNDLFAGTSGDDTLNGTVAGETIHGAGGNDTLNGNSGNDTLFGESGNDKLNGGSGADTMAGGTGNDIYGVDNVSDLVTELVGEGTDIVQSSVSYALGANIENLTLTEGAGSINGAGNGLANMILGNESANTLTGLGGDDTLNGGAGADTLLGGTGNDTYVVDDAGDVTTELPGEGTDAVQSSITYMLGADIENLTLAFGAGSIDGTGNGVANSILGNESANTLTGLGGDDTLNGGMGVDTLIGGTGNDYYIVDNAGDTVTELAGEGTDTVQSSADNFTLGANLENLTLEAGAGGINGTGNSLDNVILGNTGPNRMDGGTGADTMTGGLGDDTYVVDNVGDVVIETPIFGSDTVESSIAYTLDANLENLTLTSGAGSIGGTGNSLANVLLGNESNNTLTGLDGNDTLDGGAGADTMIGGAGNDTYVVENAGDVVTELSGEGTTDTVLSSFTYTLGANVERLTLMSGAGSIDGTGNSLANIITGNEGNNRLEGGAGDDRMIGGAGDDTYILDSSDDFITAVTELAGGGTDTVVATGGSGSIVFWDNVENLTLGAGAFTGQGNNFANVMLGNENNNNLQSLGGNDTLDGGTGADTMSGGTGNDTYFVDNVGDLAIEQLNEGLDFVRSSVTFTLGGNVEHLTLIGAGSIGGTGNNADNQISGNEASNTLTGLGGNDTLDGGAGADTMIGGAGNDTYVVDNAGDSVTELVGEGTDLVTSSVSFTLSAGIENLTLKAGAGSINGTGNDLANVLIGNEGANTLIGLGGDDVFWDVSGTDTMIGGTGNDSYMMYTSGVVLIELADEGTDTVSAWNTYTLAANFENLSLQGAGPIDGTGNGQANYITGTTASNILIGLGGDDTLDGYGGADTMIGGTGNDTYWVDNVGDVVTELAGEGTDAVVSMLSYVLGANIENLTLNAGGVAGAAIDGTGNSLANTIIGTFGNNRLDGGAGGDTMIGGAGNDLYLVDNVGDVVTELTGEGIDNVWSSLSFTLGANVENLALMNGAGAIDGTGNALQNSIGGNESNNRLDGGAGADIMAGGAGNDIYVFDNIGDGAFENAGEGTDLVLSSVTTALNINIDNLTLTSGAGSIDGAGNELSNVIIGNEGNNRLDGGTGADTMAGSTGNDTYIVDNAGDVVTEQLGEGTDLVQSSINYVLGANVENLLLATGAINGTGNSLANVILGNASNNALSGLAGNDTLNGGVGNDTIDGGVGFDTAVFDYLRSEYQVIWDYDVLRVTRAGETDSLFNVEQLNFSDGTALVETFGPAAVTIEAFGATQLVDIGVRSYLRDSSGVGPAIKYLGAAFVDGQFGAWTGIGAEQIGSGYQVVFKNGTADQYVVWNLDGNGNYLGNALGVVSGSDVSLQLLETTFQQDLNGNGQIGLVPVTIEAVGVTNLVQLGNQFSLQDSGGAGPTLKYQGAAVIAGQFGAAWAAIGAEQVGSGYQIAFKNGTADQYAVWNVDGNGNMLDLPAGILSGSSSTLQLLETTFQRDLNGNGQIGLVPITIEAFGVTKLVQLGSQFFLQDSGGAGPTLKYQGAAFVEGQFGAWTALGAEQTAGGYMAAFKNGAADQYVIWNLDGGGNYIGNATGVVAGSDPGLRALELAFHQDLNGNGQIGSASSLAVEQVVSGPADFSATSAYETVLLAETSDTLTLLLATYRHEL